MVRLPLGLKETLYVLIPTITVNQGLVIPQSVARPTVLDGNRSWYSSELEDRIILVINNPTTPKVKMLHQRPDEFYRTKRLDVT